jgi:uncharacterized protein (TIGR02145 family)
MKTIKTLLPLLLLTALALCLFSGCKKEPLPVIQITGIPLRSQTSITCNITITGDAEITRCGICWSTHSDPTFDDKITIESNDISSFTSIATDLSPNILYYIRAYATSAGGTVYSEQMERMTYADTVSDIDGNVYNTITIGTHVWMVENLKTATYRNGDAIPNLTGSSDWTTTTSGACCDYNSSTYGKFYNFYAVADPRGICPEGWHVATDDDWKSLMSYAGASGDTAGAMAEPGIAHWKSPAFNADNSSGFTALPGSFRDLDGTNHSQGYGGYWWTSNTYIGSNARYCSIYHNEHDVNRDHCGKRNGLSVRCVKD